MVIYIVVIVLGGGTLVVAVAVAQFSSSENELDFAVVAIMPCMRCNWVIPGPVTATHAGWIMVPLDADLHAIPLEGYARMTQFGDRKYACHYYNYCYCYYHYYYYYYSYYYYYYYYYY